MDGAEMVGGGGRAVVVVSLCDEAKDIRRREAGLARISMVFLVPRPVTMVYDGHAIPGRNDAIASIPRHPS